MATIQWDEQVSFELDVDIADTQAEQFDRTESESAAEEICVYSVCSVGDSGGTKSTGSATRL